MPKRSAETVERLLSDVEWALEKGLGARDLVPMLERLLRRAASGSDAWVFASRQLAEQVVQRDPWRAAGLARRVLESCDDDRSWAVLALALTLMGHYRAAARAYRRALALAPDCPNHLHNLGHLLDVALDRPRSALPYLKLAHQAVPYEPEIAASYAHALARAGRVDEARRLLEKTLPDSPELIDRRLNDWLTAEPPGSARRDGSEP